MKVYNAQQIRNIALLGHHGSGKTTLCEAILFANNITSRMGLTSEKNTVGDYTKEERNRQMTISTSLIPIEYKGYKYNFLDTPGYFDFLVDVRGAVSVSKGAMILIDASSGIEVGTEKAWKEVRRKNMPALIFVNKMDKENVNFDKIMDQLRESFGKAVVPFEIPILEKEHFKGFIDIVEKKARFFDGNSMKDGEIPKEYSDRVAELREMVVESVAETDDELLEKYFEGEAFTDEEIHKGLRKGVLCGDLIPVVCGTATQQIGIETLMEVIREYMPAPSDIKKFPAKKIGEENYIDRKVSEKEPFSAFIFKTLADPYVGKISLMKVYSGSVSKDDEVYNTNKEEKEKIGNLFALRGKEQMEIPKLCAGDIGAVAKLSITETGDTLCDKDSLIKFDMYPVPPATLFKGVMTKRKQDEEKIGDALHKLSMEDISFSMERNKETKQLLLGGQGNIQLEVLKEKLNNTFGVEIELEPPRIAFRETIKGKAEVQGKHKKQSGGAGQYGDVWVRFEPFEGDFEFAEEVVGGSVPRNYIPAVEKGLIDCIKKGVLAGYPVVNMKATLYDGSYHAVDSNEMAFKVAASLAFKKGMKAAKPVLLEPIMSVVVNVPDDYMGDIMGDMNKRRGRIIGMEKQDDGSQNVIAEAPMAELFEYTIDLKSLTQARGSYIMEFARYEEVPTQIAEEIISKSNEE